ncbi:hypothetical protein ACJJH9_00110 (plasmid) [Microbulbifer sp. DLAB2-AF]|uniref:hypothetical protein n=1 Tax=Microbulbifer sp. DLAB2-AF TaxID=3243395 RepID=UPI004039AA6A
MPKLVSAAAKSMLEMGDQIIAWVKEAAPYGSGNNHNTHTGDCHTSGLTSKTLDGSTYMWKEKGTASQWVQNDWNRPQRRAAAVFAYQAGNCQDLAALAYCYCRDHFSESTTVKYVVNRSFGHAYVIVEFGSDKVVVDPWPLYAQAVLVEDHFCGSNYDEVHKNSPGLVSNTPPHNLKKPSRVSTAYERSWTIPVEYNYSLDCTKQYTHRYCTSSQHYIDYSTSIY